MSFVMIIKPGFLHLTARLRVILARACVLIRIVERVKIPRELIKNFYEMHRDRPFFNELVDYMSTDPCTLIVASGNLKEIRKIIGATDPIAAKSNTIRNLYGKDVQRNVIHCSDSQESADHELNLLKGYLYYG